MLVKGCSLGPAGSPGRPLLASTAEAAQAQEPVSAQACPGWGIPTSPCHHTITEADEGLQSRCPREHNSTHCEALSHRWAHLPCWRSSFSCCASGTASQAFSRCAQSSMLLAGESPCPRAVAPAYRNLSKTETSQVLPCMRWHSSRPQTWLWCVHTLSPRAPVASSLSLL